MTIDDYRRLLIFFIIIRISSKSGDLLDHICGDLRYATHIGNVRLTYNESMFIKLRENHSLLDLMHKTYK